ncbi:hypothetical protein FKP32DRAFT_412248 [Trametes sanguinea]|nr:hypothetical protein FKP32DRAFT_412248 [Trametes sanguinea]
MRHVQRLRDCLEDRGGRPLSVLPQLAALTPAAPHSKERLATGAFTAVAACVSQRAGPRLALAQQPMGCHHSDTSPCYLTNERHVSDLIDEERPGRNCASPLPSGQPACERLVPLFPQIGTSGHCRICALDRTAGSGGDKRTDSSLPLPPSAGLALREDSSSLEDG